MEASSHGPGDVRPLIVWLLVQTNSASHAVEITRWDAFVDVWRTSKNKVLIDGAPTRLRFKVISGLSPHWALRMYLDTHGSPRADYRLRHFEGFGRSGCNVIRLPDGEPHHVPCDLTFIDPSPDVLLAKLW